MKNNCKIMNNMLKLNCIFCKDVNSLDFNSILTAISDFLWGWPMIIVLLGTHLFMTVRTGFIQRKLFTGIKLSVKKDPDSHGDISQFQALTTALASTIGTGNIVGVGTAIALGGPGAVFWCWITGVLGIATKYAESLIGVKYRVKAKDGTMVGGAMYALERGLGLKWLGVLFAIFAALATFGIGNGVQVNAIANILNQAFDSASNLTVTVGSNEIGIINIICGIIIAVLVAVVLYGGVKSISKVCEKLIPFMAILYVLGCIYILIYNHKYVGEAIVDILQSAFSIKAAVSGGIGAGMMMACRYGIARGLFSNESGMGSAPIVAAAAQTRNPVRQALISSTGTFWDTVVVCLMTGLVLVSSMHSDSSIATTGNGGDLTFKAFSQIPYVGIAIIVIGIVLFAFSTILGWAYYGERCVVYLLGTKALKFYRMIFIIIVLISPVISLDAVWTIADILNALMAIPNIIAIWLLNKVIADDTKHYLGNLDEIDRTPIPTIDKSYD